MTLDGLKPTNTFERKLLDVLVAMAHGGVPIPVRIEAAPVVAYDDSAMRSVLAIHEQRIAELRMVLDQLTAVAKQHKADMRQILEMLSHHTHETIKQVA